MTRILIIALFVVSFATALYVYLSRSSETLEARLERSGNREPRIIMEDFLYYKFAGTTIKTRLAAQRADFLEPNIMRLSHGVKAVRFGNTALENEELVAQTATAYLDSQNLDEMTNQSRVVKAVVEDQVSLRLRDHTITTDYAEYLPTENVIFSPKPMRTAGPGRWFTGDGGFRYDLTHERLDISGDVKGAVIPDEKTNKIGNP